MNTFHHKGHPCTCNAMPFNTGKKTASSYACALQVSTLGCRHVSHAEPLNLNVVVSAHKGGTRNSLMRSRTKQQKVLTSNNAIAGTVNKKRLLSVCRDVAALSAVCGTSLLRLSVCDCYAPFCYICCTTMTKSEGGKDVFGLSKASWHG